MQESMEIDFVDLLQDGYRYKTPLLLDESNKTDQVIDYQMKIKSADWVVFFYQTVLGTMPGHLKSFLDAVMTPGVAYSTQDSAETYLDEKKATVYVFEPRSQMEAQLFNANREDFFWNRMVFRSTGLNGELKQFFNSHKVTPSYLDKVFGTLRNIITSYRPQVQE